MFNMQSQNDLATSHYAILAIHPKSKMLRDKPVFINYIFLN